MQLPSWRHSYRMHALRLQPRPKRAMQQGWVLPGSGAAPAHCAGHMHAGQGPLCAVAARLEAPQRTLGEGRRVPGGQAFS